MCAIFGMIDYNKKLNVFERHNIIRTLSKECEVRGTDATGISYVCHDGLHVYKKAVKASKFNFYLPYESRMVIGHTRMTTKGNESKNYNNHPFFGNTSKGRFALAHNGVLYNDEILRAELKLPETFIETDSYIAVQLLEYYGEINFENIAAMAETVSGSFCFSILTDKNELYLVKGSNPLAIYDCGGYYLYASTSDILDKTLKKLNISKKKIISIESGEILKISADGTIQRSYFDFMDDYFGGYKWKNYYSDFDCYDDDVDEEELENLIMFANWFGIEEEDIMLLLEMGYSTMDIEELLYDVEELKTIISECKESLVYDYVE